MSDEEKTMTREQFLRLRSYQDSCCALCGRQSNNLDLDHDHRSMLVRGMLCNPCNLRLAEYERKKRLYAHYEAYLADPPMKVLGLQVLYKPAAKPKEKAS